MLRAIERRADKLNLRLDGRMLQGKYVDPCDYAREVLKVQWWEKQREIAHKLTVPPYRVLAKACHEVGKTHLAGGLVNWWYDTYDPGLVLTTAPTDTQVRDLLWKEVRAQRGARAGFRGPRMPRLESGPRHWAHGFTARDYNAFQGRHEEKVLVIFDEAVGVAPEFWEAAESMYSAWLCVFNPTSTDSQAYIEERAGGWHVVVLTSMEHPNISAELAGQTPPFPAALRLHRLNHLIRKWCAPIAPDASKSGDIEWAPGSGQWWRPGPVAEARLFGRWPSLAVNTVWSEIIWELAETTVLAEPRHADPEIGCDVARFGDDFTSIHIRRAGTSVFHETYNGQGTDYTAGRLKQLCREWGKRCNCKCKQIRVKIDDDGVGGGVWDQREDFHFIRVSAASTDGCDTSEHPNLRSQLWFQVKDAAEKGMVSFAALPPSVRQEIRRQALAPKYTLDSKGRRVVESKDATKAGVLKRSPDDMDAVNLAYHPADDACVAPLRLTA